MSKSRLHGTEPSNRIPGSQGKKGKKPVPWFSLFAYGCTFGPEDNFSGSSPKGHKKIILIQRHINHVQMDVDVKVGIYLKSNGCSSATDWVMGAKT